MNKASKTIDVVFVEKDQDGNEQELLRKEMKSSFTRYIDFRLSSQDNFRDEVSEIVRLRIAEALENMFPQLLDDLSSVIMERIRNDRTPDVPTNE